MIDRTSKNLPLDFWLELVTLRTYIQDAGFYSKQRLDVSMWTDAAVDCVNDLIINLPSLLNQSFPSHE